jgi:hypothetical protein
MHRKAIYSSRGLEVCAVMLAIRMIIRSLKYSILPSFCGAIFAASAPSLAWLDCERNQCFLKRQLDTSGSVETIGPAESFGCFSDGSLVFANRKEFRWLDKDLSIRKTYNLQNAEILGISREKQLIALEKGIVDLRTGDLSPYPRNIAVEKVIFLANGYTLLFVPREEKIVVLNKKSTHASTLPLPFGIYEDCINFGANLICFKKIVNAEVQIGFYDHPFADIFTIKNSKLMLQTDKFRLPAVLTVPLDFNESDKSILFYEQTDKYVHELLLLRNNKQLDIIKSVEGTGKIVYPKFCGFK